MKIRKLHLAMLSACALHSVPAMSAGFQLSEHSAAGTGRANAGEAAIADSAAVISHNAAAMSMFDRINLSVMGAIIAPDVWVTGDTQLDNINNQLTNNDVVPDVALGSVYFIQPINDSWAWGIGIFTDFGLATQYPADYLAGPIAGETELKTLNFNPNVSWRINEQFSLGAGVSAVYGTAQLTRNFGVLGDETGVPRESTLANLDGDGWGWGWNLGALWEITDNHRLALSYRSKVDVEFTGDYYSDLPAGFPGPPTGTGGQGGKVEGELTLNLPDIFEFAGYHRLADPFALHYSYVHTGWSSFKELRATVNDQTVLQKDENFKDSYKVSLGGTWYITDNWEARVGIAYDTTPSKDLPSISIPDEDRMNYSIGASYRFTDSISVDAGYTYIDGQERSFSEELTEESSVAFRSRGTAHILAAQYNHRF